MVVADVLGVEDGRLAEAHHAVLADRERAEVAGFEGLALLARDLPGLQRDGGVRGERAELRRVPQLEGVDRAVLDVRAHVVGGAEPGELDLALVLRAGEVLRRRLDADRGRRDDPLQPRVLLEEPLRLLERLLGVVVPVHDLDELDALVLRLLQLVLHEVDPRVLVRRRLGRREDRDLALVADLLRHLLHLRAAEVLGARLRDEDVAAAGPGVGVVRDDADAVLHGLLERGAQRPGVLRRDGDAVDLLLREGVDVGDLPGGVGAAAGADLLVRRTERGERLLAAVVGGREVRVVDLLGQEGDREALLRGGARVGLRRRTGGGLLLLGVALRGASAGGGAEDEGRRHGERRGEPAGAGGHGHEASLGSVREGRDEPGDQPVAGAACVRARALARATRRPTRGARTETTSRTPVTTICDCAETLSRLMTFWSVPSRNTPAIAPPRVPLPPSKSMPPSSTAAMTESSSPVALS
ncbi:putative rhamnose ABC transporter, rhamnose-binding protein [Streptomyces sp. Tu6071]|nr:putative rhamnose ABC transporter, rhamnose-binding protein [Streptomyces sp. Tu6071]